MTPVLGRETLDHIRTIGGLSGQSLFGLNLLCRIETVLSSHLLTGGYIDKIFVLSTDAAASIVHADENFPSIAHSLTAIQ